MGFATIRTSDGFITHSPMEPRIKFVFDGDNMWSITDHEIFQHNSDGYTLKGGYILDPGLGTSLVYDGSYFWVGQYKYPAVIGYPLLRYDPSDLSNPKYLTCSNIPNGEFSTYFPETSDIHSIFFDGEKGFGLPPANHTP